MLSKNESEDLLEYAKLTKTNFQKTCQVLMLDNKFSTNNYCIFKLNKDITKELTKSDFIGKYIIKGNEDQLAILCTEDKNYQIIEAETSNTLLCVENLNTDKSNKENEFCCELVNVTASCNKIFEFKQRKASPCEVYSLLKNSILIDHLDEEDLHENVISFESLFEQVQMSKSELKEIISVLKVIRYNKKLFLLSYDYLCNILQKVFECSIENDMSFDMISKDLVEDILKVLFPVEIINQIFEYYFEEVICNSSLSKYYKVNLKDVCRSFGCKILKECSKMKLSRFQKQWIALLPPEIVPDINFMLGFGVVDDYEHKKNKKTIYIYYLNKYEIDVDLGRRFNDLFALKSHWKQEELEEYLIDVLPPDVTVSQLLMKYCRSSTSSDGIKWFTKR